MELATKFFTGAFGLIAIYLLLKDGGQGANTILNGLGQFNAKTFGTLQGR
jgi:hypothetical protein